MRKGHTTVELPAQQQEFDTMLEDPAVRVDDVRFSSVEVDGEVRHYVLVLYAEREDTDLHF